MAASLVPIALRVLPAVGGAAAGGAGYEAIEQTVRHIKNKVTGHRSRSRSRADSKSSGRRHDDRDHRRRTNSSRSSSRPSSSSSERGTDHRRHASTRHKRDSNNGSRRRHLSRRDPRYGSNGDNDGIGLNPQNGALVIRREDSSDENDDKPEAFAGRFPPRDPGPSRTKLPRRTTHPQGPSRNPPPNPFEPQSNLHDQPSIQAQMPRGFSSEAEFRVYAQALEKSSDVLHRQSIHPMTPEDEKRVARRILLERGWRPQTPPSANYGQHFPTGERYLASADSLSLAQRQTLERNEEQLYSPEELRAQRSVGDIRPPGYSQGFYDDPYHSDHGAQRASGRRKRGYAFMEAEDHSSGRRSQSQQSRNDGGRYASRR